MEQRKLIQHGLSSLTVALPMKWIKERDLNKGDSVLIDEDGHKLIVSTEKTLKVEKVSVDITELDRTSALIYIMSLYRFGYNEIEVEYKRPTTIHFRTGKEIRFSHIIHYIISRLIGVEIVEEKKDKVIIKKITEESGEELNRILRRVFLLVNEAADTLLEGIKQQDMNLVASIEDKHDNINKFVNYSLRLLNKFGYPDARKTTYYSHIIASIDKIVDIIKYAARNILKQDKKFHKDTIEIWERVNKSLRYYYELFFDYKQKYVVILSKNRDHTKQLLKKKAKNIPHDELLLLTAQKQILEIILDLTDFRMGLEH